MPLHAPILVEMSKVEAIQKALRTLLPRKGFASVCPNTCTTIKTGKLIKIERPRRYHSYHSLVGTGHFPHGNGVQDHTEAFVGFETGMADPGPTPARRARAFADEHETPTTSATAPLAVSY